MIVVDKFDRKSELVKPFLSNSTLKGTLDSTQRNTTPTRCFLFLETPPLEPCDENFVNEKGYKNNVRT